MTTLRVHCWLKLNALWLFGGVGKFEGDQHGKPLTLKLGSIELDSTCSSNVHFSRCALALDVATSPGVWTHTHTQPLSSPLDQRHKRSCAFLPIFLGAGKPLAYHKDVCFGAKDKDANQCIGEKGGTVHSFMASKKRPAAQAATPQKRPATASVPGLHCIKLIATSSDGLQTSSS